MEAVFGVVAGVIAILVGLALIIKRKDFSKFSADAQRSTFGKAGEKVADRANPAYTGLVGEFFVVFGVALVVVMLSGVKIR